jgi:hypothetical protein
VLVCKVAHAIKNFQFKSQNLNSEGEPSWDFQTSRLFKNVFRGQGLHHWHPFIIIYTCVTLIYHVRHIFISFRVYYFISFLFWGNCHCHCLLGLYGWQWRQSVLKPGGSYCVIDMDGHPPQPNPHFKIWGSWGVGGLTTPNPPGLTPMTDGILP